MALVVDLSAGEGGTGGFEAFGGGTYHLAITDAEIAESGPQAKNPGANYIKFEFTIQSGAYENRKLWVNASLLPQALFTLKGILAATGRDPEASLDVEEYVEECQGDECIGVVKVRPKKEEYADYKGQKENYIKSFKALGSVPLQDGAPLDPPPVGVVSKAPGASAPAKKGGKKDPLLP